MNRTILLLFIFTMSAFRMYSQVDQKESDRDFGATKFLITGHTTITAVLDSGQSNFSDANFSAIFLYQLSNKLFVESEIEMTTGDGVVDIGLEHANLIWLLNDNIAFHAGRFVPHFGMYRGRLAEGFMNRFPTNPVGFGDGGIGTMEAVGFGFQGGFALGISKMNYDLWVSNGPELLTDAENAGQFDYEAYTDNNKNKALGGRIGFLPFSNSSLELGVSYENTSKTENQYSLEKSIGVRALAIDANFYHNIPALKSTIRLIGEYKKQDVDKYDYPIIGDPNGETIKFNNTANTYYALASVRPTGSDNNIFRNFELAFRYSKYTTPNGAPWANYDENGKNIPISQTAIALNYWLKWNCVAKVCYQTQTNVTNQVYIQLYYGF